jgi:glycosyltransferase involved in cell wall biosynthesis
MSYVSIIITCYNLGSYLMEAVDGALRQTYSDFEIILIDDGSTDLDTIALLDRLSQDRRLRFIRSANQGPANARNHAIRQSSGVYILPLDADDRILPDYLVHAIPILDKQPNVGFVGCHYRTFGERQVECRPETYSLPHLLIENVVPVASIFRRSCWEQSKGYCADLNGIEDWDLWIQILEQGYTGAVLPEIYFEYRVRHNSMFSRYLYPEAYQQHMNLFYERHRNLYNTYIYQVLLGKDAQMATLHSYMRELEQAAQSWEKVAQDRLGIIQAIRSKMMGSMSKI